MKFLIPILCFLTTFAHADCDRLLTTGPAQILEHSVKVGALNRERVLAWASGQIDYQALLASIPKTAVYLPVKNALARLDHQALAQSDEVREWLGRGQQLEAVRERGREQTRAIIKARTLLTLPADIDWNYFIEGQNSYVFLKTHTSNGPWTMYGLSLAQGGEPELLPTYETEIARNSWQAGNVNGQLVVLQLRPDRIIYGKPGAESTQTLEIESNRADSRSLLYRNIATYDVVDVRGQYALVLMEFNYRQKSQLMVIDLATNRRVGKVITTRYSKAKLGINQKGEPVVAVAGGNQLQAFEPVRSTRPTQVFKITASVSTKVSALEIAFDSQGRVYGFLNDVDEEIYNLYSPWSGPHGSLEEWAGIFHQQGHWREGADGVMRFVALTNDYKLYTLSVPPGDFPQAKVTPGVQATLMQFLPSGISLAHDQFKIWDIDTHEVVFEGPRLGAGHKVMSVFETGSRRYFVTSDTRGMHLFDAGTGVKIISDPEGIAPEPEWRVAGNGDVTLFYMSTTKPAKMKMVKIEKELE